MPDAINEGSKSKDFQQLEFVMLYQSNGWASYTKVSQLCGIYGRECNSDDDTLSPQENLFVDVVGH